MDCHRVGQGVVFLDKSMMGWKTRRKFYYVGRGESPEMDNHKEEEN